MDVENLQEENGTKSENDTTEPNSEDKEEETVTVSTTESNSVEASNSPENPSVEDVVTSSDNNKNEDEPQAKKLKVGEEALKKIEAEILLKEKEKQDAEILFVPERGGNGVRAENHMNSRSMDRAKFRKMLHLSSLLGDD